MTPWTETEMQKLAELLTLGQGAVQMSKQLGRTENAIRSKIAVLRGKRTNSGKMIDGTGPSSASYDAPALRKNDDGLHLRLIYEALQTEGRANAL